MDSDEHKGVAPHWSRRTFLQAARGLPTLSIVLNETARLAAGQTVPAAEDMSRKFTPIDLSTFFTASSAAFGMRERAKEIGGRSALDGLIRMPAGRTRLQGIPFWLGPEAVEAESWIALSTQPHSWATSHVEIPLRRGAHFICLASFCDWDPNETLPGGDVLDHCERVGQGLGNLVLIYDDGSEHSWPIRRRFEVNSPTYRWGHAAFAAMPHGQAQPVKLTDRLMNAKNWGVLQQRVREGRPVGPVATLWIAALQNPAPNRPLRALRLEATASDSLAICGITLFHGLQSPLRYTRLCLYRFTLPESTAEEAGRWSVGVDLGIVARTYTLTEFSPEAWLSSPVRGVGQQAEAVHGARYLYAEITASPAATVTLSDSLNGQEYHFDLNDLTPGKELAPRLPNGSGNVISTLRAQVLERDKVWLRAQVFNSTSQSPTPVRLAFRSKDGRYIPPYGRPTEINDGFFQDYGADVKLLDTSFAYVDGTFQVELPVGEVFVEITKGFEYEAIRKKLDIKPGQDDLRLEIPRFVDLRSKGWVTADSHVHFISPTTAVLEGQAEGLNLINLLAAQWGDLFTNVADLSQGPASSRDGETVVWVGTENRQHILGHIALLGGHGEPVFPMGASGPGRGVESYRRSGLDKLGRLGRRLPQARGTRGGRTYLTPPARLLRISCWVSTMRLKCGLNMNSTAFDISTGIAI
jgi:hypothetical protein